ncbi:MAG: discoidin domain-containing protein [Planctomycetes bacterium]|nr:discoidin domain-containing protein [Planctomycetota bacterium]
MTLLEAIELVKARPPAEVTALELANLRACLEQNPTAHTVLGGREKCDAYIAQVELALSRPPAIADVVTLSALPSAEAKPQSCRGVEVAMMGLLVILAIGGFSWYALDGFKMSATPVAPITPVVAAVEVAAPPPKKPAPTPVQPPTVKPPKKVALAPPPKAADDEPDKWQGWTIKPTAGALVARKSDWDVSDPRNPRPQLFLVTGAHEVNLTAPHTVTPQQQWLEVRVSALTPAPERGQIELRVEGQPAARFPIPPWDSGHRFAIPLTRWQGKPVKLELVHLPRSKEEQIQWREIRYIASPSQVEWTVIKPVTAQSSDGATLKIEPDSGNSREQAAKLHGRYVRLEMPGPNRSIALAEVQVMSASNNVAVGKAATQSSTQYEGAPATKAVDGNNSGRTRHQSLTFTKSENDPWWEVDLGSELPIEGIHLFTRNSTPQALTNHRMVVLNAARTAVWKFQNRDVSSRELSYGPFMLNQDPVDFSVAEASGSNDPAAMEHIIGTMSPTTGWSGGGSGTPETLVLTLKPGQELANKFVSFRLQHRSHNAGQNLGRFRLSLTTDKPPIAAETPVTIVPLLGQ